MRTSTLIKSPLLTLALAAIVSSVRADYSAELETVAAINDLTSAPNMYTTATGSILAATSAGEITAVYVKGENYEGSSTRFYAYIGIPMRVPAIRCTMVAVPRRAHMFSLWLIKGLPR